MRAIALAASIILAQCHISCLKVCEEVSTTALLERLESRDSRVRVAAQQSLLDRDDALGIVRQVLNGDNVSPEVRCRLLEVAVQVEGACLAA